MKLIGVCAFICLFAITAGQRQIRQCQCHELQPCYQAMKQAVQPCARQCQHSLSRLGNGQAMVTCVLRKRAAIDRTWECIVQQSGQYCSNDPSAVVNEKTLGDLRYEAEATVMQTSFVGIINKIRPILNVIGDFADCVKNCVEQRSNNCFAALQCGLAMPNPQYTLDIGRNCANQNGFDVNGLTRACNCVTTHTKGNLKSLCPLISTQLG